MISTGQRGSAIIALLHFIVLMGEQEEDMVTATQEETDVDVEAIMEANRVAEVAAVRVMVQM